MLTLCERGEEQDSTNLHIYATSEAAHQAPHGAKLLGGATTSSAESGEVMSSLTVTSKSGGGEETT